MLDRSKCEKMLVSIDGEKWCERIVIDIRDDNSCLVVHELDEQDFINGIDYDVAIWPKCKPIPEKQQIEKIDIMGTLKGEDRYNVVCHIALMRHKQSEIIDALNKLLEKE